MSLPIALHLIFAFAVCGLLVLLDNPVRSLRSFFSLVRRCLCFALTAAHRMRRRRCLSRSCWLCLRRRCRRFLSSLNGLVFQPSPTVRLFHPCHSKHDNRLHPREYCRITTRTRELQSWEANLATSWPIPSNCQHSKQHCCEMDY